MPHKPHAFGCPEFCTANLLFSTFQMVFTYRGVNNNNYVAVDYSVKSLGLPVQKEDFLDLQRSNFYQLLSG
jgi:hypothetical protein